MNNVLTTITITGNEDLQTSLSAMFRNPKYGDTDWLLARFYETPHDWDNKCYGTNSASLSNIVITDGEVVMLCNSHNEIPNELLNRMVDIFKEIDENFTLSATYDDSEHTFLGAYYANSYESASTEKQMSSMIDNLENLSKDEIENHIWNIKQTLLNDCMEMVNSDNDLDYIGDDVNDNMDDGWDESLIEDDLLWDAEDE